MSNLREIMYGKTSDGVQRDNHITFNFNITTVGFTGVYSAVVPFTQELFDQLERLKSTHSIDISHLDIKFYDALNKRIYPDITAPRLSCPRHFTYMFKCRTKEATNGVLKSNRSKTPGIPIGINPTEFM